MWQNQYMAPGSPENACCLFEAEEKQKEKTQVSLLNIWSSRLDGKEDSEVSSSVNQNF